MMATRPGSCRRSRVTPVHSVGLRHPLIPIGHTRGRGSRNLASALTSRNARAHGLSFLACGRYTGCPRSVATATPFQRGFRCQSQTQQLGSRTSSWSTAASSTERVGRRLPRAEEARPQGQHRPEPDRVARRRRGGDEAGPRRAGRPGRPRRPFLRRRGGHGGRQRPEGRGAGLHRRLRAGQGRVGVVAHQGPAPGGAPVPPILPPQDGFLFLDQAKFHAPSRRTSTRTRRPSWPTPGAMGRRRADRRGQTPAWSRSRAGTWSRPTTR